jgi:hypothetical protein
VELHAYAMWFHLLLRRRAHVTLTAHILQTAQTDITQHGWFFGGWFFGTCWC